MVKSLSQQVESIVAGGTYNVLLGLGGEGELPVDVVVHSIRVVGNVAEAA